MSEAHVAVTGVGLVTALGIGVIDNWRRLLAGESGVRPITRFVARGLPTTFAAAVDFFDLPRDATIEERAIAMGDRVVDEALRQAGWPAPGPFDGGFFIAPPVHDIEWPRLLATLKGADAPTYAAAFGQIARGVSLLAGSNLTVPLHYAKRHQLARLPACVTTACASGASAVQLAIEAIGRGECDRAVVLGTDAAVRPEMIARFSLLSALSTSNDSPERASKPFSLDRDGFVMGEGAGALVLETTSGARTRGAKVLACVLGCGEAGDNFHRTRSSPDAQPIVKCMRAALEDGAITADDVDYVNAHGTSTPENDKMESMGIRLLFGARAHRVPVSSVKSMIGHTLAAAGAVEAVCTVMSIVTGMLPPTINHRAPDPEIGLDVVANVARSHRVRCALSNSFGFGGQNVCIAIGAHR